MTAIPRILRVLSALLRAYGFNRARFFVTVGWMGAVAGYMDWPQLKEVIQSGHDVQSHGWSHRLLTECADHALAEELRCSKATLEDRLGLPVNEISLPGGAWDKRVLRACIDAGYSRLYTSDPWGGVQERNGLKIFGRLMVRGNMPADDLVRLLATEKNRFAGVRIPFYVRQALRQIIGTRRYHRIWCAVANYKEPPEVTAFYQENQQQPRGCKN